VSPVFTPEVIEVSPVFTPQAEVVPEIAVEPEESPSNLFNLDLEADQADLLNELMGSDEEEEVEPVVKDIVVVDEPEEVIEPTVGGDIYIPEEEELLESPVVLEYPPPPMEMDEDYVNAILDAESEGEVNLDVLNQFDFTEVETEAPVIVETTVPVIALDKVASHLREIQKTPTDKLSNLSIVNNQILKCLGLVA